MNHPQVNGEMGQGFGLHNKQKQQVENRGNHSGGNVFLFQEDHEGEIERAPGWGMGFPGCQMLSETCTSTFG